MRIVRGWDLPSLRMSCAVVYFMAAKRSGVVFSTRWDWSQDVLHYVLLKTGGAYKVWCVLDAFSALCSPSGAMLQWEMVHWCCAFIVLPRPHTSAYVYGLAAFDPHTALPGDAVPR